jgi:hypothetical protein
MRGGEQRPHPHKTNPWLDPSFRERVSASVKQTFATPQSKKLRSKVSKGLWSDPTFRENVTSSLIVSQSSAETRARMSEGMRRRYEDPEQRKRSSKRWDDPVYRAKCSVGLTGGKNKNKSHCSNGHEFTLETSFIDTQGYRRCDICRQERNIRRRKERNALQR